MTANQFSSRAFLSDNEEQLGALGLWGSWTVKAEDGKPWFDATLRVGDCFRTASVPFIVSGDKSVDPALRKIRMFQAALTDLERELLAFAQARS